MTEDANSLMELPAVKGELAAICAQMSLALMQVSHAIRLSHLGKTNELVEALEKLDETQQFFVTSAEKIYGQKL